MLRSDGEPLLMDFGLASRVETDGQGNQAGRVVGTPDYMAPEQARGEAEAASDQYYPGKHVSHPDR
jgi:serine/threonine protein kinase